MIDEYLRAPYQRFFAIPLAKNLNSKITANQITLLSAILGLLVLPSVIFGHTLLAISLLLLSGIGDTLDGTVARLRQQSSDWGSVLDIMSDRLVEFSLILSLYLIAPEERGLWCLLMVGSVLLCITSFLVVGIFTANDSEKSFHYSPGLMERAEAFIFIIAMLLFPSAFIALSVLFVLLVTLTAIIRLHQFYQQQDLSLNHG